MAYFWMWLTKIGWFKCYLLSCASWMEIVFIWILKIKGGIYLPEVFWWLTKAYLTSMEEKKWLTLLFLMPALSKAFTNKFFWIKINLVVLRKTWEYTYLGAIWWLTACPNYISISCVRIQDTFQWLKLVIKGQNGFLNYCANEREWKYHHWGILVAY